ncbi:hypothetical protein [uncultured Sphingomonas sp.]|uniref:hypothetical protein n=1 Tax=uncultured Sphingomonas sp. TaxID=158754 RepID=UPI0025CBFF69|nr:hypothetical protein [uncultured Sphingomonas sp.]
MRAYILGLAFALAACGGTVSGNAGNAETPAPAAARTSPPALDSAPPPATATPEPPSTNAGAAATNTIAVAPETLPADVVTFKARRDECDHFRGEDADDEARAAQLEQELNRTCKGTDSALAGLRRRYAANAAVIAALANYESDVE